MACRALAEASGHDDLVRWLDEHDPAIVDALEEGVMALGVEDDGVEAGRPGDGDDAAESDDRSLG